MLCGKELRTPVSPLRASHCTCINEYFTPLIYIKPGNLFGCHLRRHRIFDATEIMAVACSVPPPSRGSVHLPHHSLKRKSSISVF